MFLALKDLARLFTDKRGTQDEILFYTVSDLAALEQSKGLFVPINKESGELLEAISNGAVAAIWEKDVKLPHYLPNQFPIFLTDDPAAALRDIINHYIEKIDGETNKHMEKTIFKISNKKLLNKNNQTYDIAGQLAKLTSENNQERRG
jgi:UDP-N-acetylmuramyl pentapeptide synthase